MTVDEKRQQKAMLLLEYQEAEQELAHLREKAGRTAEPFNEVAIWLKHANLPVARSGNEDETRDAEIRANLGRYREAVNFDNALALMDEISAAKNTLQVLAERKSNLR